MLVRCCQHFCKTSPPSSCSRSLRHLRSVSSSTTLPAFVGAAIRWSRIRRSLPTLVAATQLLLSIFACGIVRLNASPFFAAVIFDWINIRRDTLSDAKIKSANSEIWKNFICVILLISRLFQLAFRNFYESPVKFLQVWSGRIKCVDSVCTGIAAAYSAHSTSSFIFRLPHCPDIKVTLWGCSCQIFIYLTVLSCFCCI